jgi:hypothetical protein
VSRLQRAPWSWPGRFVRWVYDQPPAEPTPAPGPLVLELDTIYAGGAVGAVFLRLGELHELEDAGVTADLPASGSSGYSGAAAVRARIVTRAGLYAGSTTTVERESEPPPAFLRGPRL